MKEFGLILFVYSVGVQVGPGFFSSFRKGGLQLNILAASIVFLGAITIIILHYATDIPMPTMVALCRVLPILPDWVWHKKPTPAYMELVNLLLQWGTL